MHKNAIDFKNARSLYYSGGWKTLLAHLERGRFPEEAQDLRLRGVDRILLLHDPGTPDPDDNAGELEKALVEEGFTVVRVPTTLLAEARFGELHEMGVQSLRHLKQQSLLVLYDDSLAEESLLFLACLLLSLRRSRITPETVLRLIARDESQRELAAGEVPHLLTAYQNFIATHAIEREESHEKGPGPHAAEFHPPEAPEMEKAEKAPERLAQTGGPSQTGGPAQTREESQAQAPKTVHVAEVERPEHVRPEFKASRLTIRVKLSTIVSAILAVSLLSVGYWATRLFREHTATLIQEYNLNLARLVGYRVEEELHNVVERSRTFATATGENLIPGNRLESYSALYFKNNPSTVFIATASRSGEDLRINSSFYNQAFAGEGGIPLEKIRQLTDENRKHLMKAFQGETVVENVSPGFTRPVLALSLPLVEGGNDSIILVFMDSGRLVQTFRTQRQAEVFQVMMVNEEGYVVAHSSEKETLARANRLDIPIVKNMLQSPVDNGSQRYSYKNIDYLGSFQTLNIGHLGVVSTVESQHVFEAVERIQSQNIKILLIVLILAFLLIYFMARGITTPIVKLVGATRQVEEGNYALDIAPSTHDEVGILTNSFVEMARGLEEREKIKETFGKFVNREIAEKALKGEVKLGGQSREVAIFFSDLRNFTQISERMDAEEVVEMLNTYFTEMVECVYLMNGIVDKFIGDAIMAHWGAITPTKNDTQSAVDTALLMRRAIIDLNRRHKGTRFPFLRFGCGINTGEVIAGQIGSMKKLEYTVIGDAVNLASRIEFLNKIFGTDILISSYSYERVRDHYETVAMPPIKIKGKSSEEVVYAVLGWKGDPDTPKSLAELRTLVGIEYSSTQVEEVMRSSSDSLVQKETKPE